MRKRTLVVLGAALLVAGLGVIGFLRWSSHGSPPPARPVRFVEPTIFADGRTPMWMSIQLARGRPDTGRFYLFTPDGTFTGRAGLSFGASGVRWSSADSGAFKAANTTEWVPRRMEVTGTLRPSDGDATVDIRAGAHMYHLTSTRPAALSARALARRVSAALTEADPSSLFSVLAPEVKSAVGAKVIGRWAPSLPKDARILTTGTGRESEGPDGRWYFVQPVSVVQGSATLKTSRLFLVFERGRWFLLGNDPLD